MNVRPTPSLRALVAPGRDAAGALAEAARAAEAAGGRVVGRTALTLLAIFHDCEATLAAARSVAPEARRRLALVAGLPSLDPAASDPLTATTALAALGERAAARATAAFRETLREAGGPSLAFAGLAHPPGAPEPRPLYDLLSDERPSAPAPRPPAPAEARPRTLVVPFRAAAEDAALAAALREDLVERLARFRGLAVLAEEAGRMAALVAGPAEAAARAVGADHAVEGRLAREGGRLTLSIRLVDARAGTLVWADRLTREADDLPGAGAALAEAAAAALGRRIEPDAAPEPHAQAGRAWRLAAEAKAAGDPAEAARLLDAALGLAPGSASARLGRSAQALARGFGDDLPAAARDAAAAALADPLDARPRIALGAALLAMGEVGGAAAALEAAETLNPGRADALALRAATLVALGDAAGAEARILKAMALHPFFPDGYLLTLASARHLAGDLDGAAEALARLADPAPGRVLAAAIGLRRGDEAAAERALLAAASAPPAAAPPWLPEPPEGAAAAAALDEARRRLALLARERAGR